MSETHDCHDLIQALSDYVDGELSPDLCIDLERHLCECERCRVVVNTLKKTIELYQETSEKLPLPDDVHMRLFARLNLDDYT